MPVGSPSSGYATATHIREGARWSLANVYSKVVTEAAVVSSGHSLCPQSTAAAAYSANNSHNSSTAGLLPAQQYGSASNLEVLRLFPVPPQLPAAPRSPNASGNSGGKGRRVRPAAATIWQAGGSTQCAYPLATSSVSPPPMAPQAAGPAVLERQTSPATGPAYIERQLSAESVRLPPSFNLSRDMRPSTSESNWSISANRGETGAYDLVLPAEAPAALLAEVAIPPALRRPVKAYAMAGAMESSKSLPAERTEGSVATDANGFAANRLSNRRPGTPDISNMPDRQVMVPKHVAGIRGQVLVSRRLEEEPGDASLITRNQMRRESLVEPSNTVRRPSLFM